MARLVAQCAVQPGLSRVYEELLSQGEGAEFYVEHLHRFPALRKEGATFDDAARYFRRSTPIGLLRATTAELILAPPAGLALEAGDEGAVDVKEVPFLSLTVAVPAALARPASPPPPPLFIEAPPAWRLVDPPAGAAQAESRQTDASAYSVN